MKKFLLKKLLLINTILVSVSLFAKYSSRNYDQNNNENNNVAYEDLHDIPYIPYSIPPYYDSSTNETQYGRVELSSIRENAQNFIKEHFANLNTAFLL